MKNYVCGYQIYVDEMLDAVEKGKIDVSVIDRAVARILKLKFELGLFENPYPQIDRVTNELKNTNNKDTVLELTDKAITLTKNDGILPIKDKSKKIAVIIEVDEDAVKSASEMESLTDATKYPTLSFTAYACQKEGFANAAAAWAEAQKLDTNP